ncbi:MAG: hypothetical protein JNG90_07275 [Planctomycetaceae bacterium]|nr:hypothetical protein [Planctomycetaceae bacterium]
MSTTPQLGLRPGDWVEVRSQEEILATLDDRGSLDGLVFMPEMLDFCGRRLQVASRSDKTCDTIDMTGMLRMENTVHLRGSRCGGGAHGGCQAACLLYWKEAWLRPASRSTQTQGEPPAAAEAVPQNSPAARNLEWLERLTTHDAQPDSAARYRCQATELKQAGAPIEWWYPAQYVRDVRTNGVPLRHLLYTLLLFLYNRTMLKLGLRQYPYVAGTLKRTPAETLDLQVGEWVFVKSRDEIVATLDTHGKNRGMSFEAEMLPYCGKRYRVVQRVERLVDERTGHIKQMGSVGIILEDVICASAYRTPCPRANLLYWREIWLRRAEPHEIPEPPAEAACPIRELVG